MVMAEYTGSGLSIATPSPPPAPAARPSGQIPIRHALTDNGAPATHRARFLSLQTASRATPSGLERLVSFWFKAAGCPIIPFGVLEPDSNSSLIVDVARYERLKDARERGLALSARGITHSIGREGNTWLLRVAEVDKRAATEELHAYDAEMREEESPFQEEPPVRPRFWTLPLVALTVIGGAVLQAELGIPWRDAGVLSAEKVVAAGEWWRVVTALTLHGDVPHVLANLWVGLLFGALLVPAFGQGVTWLSVLAAGAAGNALTVLAYWPQSHQSLGASTAVFGALGLLVGDALWLLLRRRSGRSWWKWMLPLGAGLSLLAFLGAGEGKTSVDVMAHLWGFAAGLPMGLCVSALRPAHAPSCVQTACGSGAAFALAFAWLRARYP
jgi:rhomboid protease GluP